MNNVKGGIMKRATLFVFAAAISFAQTKLPPAANVKIDYLKDVQPLLAQKCYSCHGDVVQQSGLRLDRRLALLTIQVDDPKGALLRLVVEVLGRVCKA